MTPTTIVIIVITLLLFISTGSNGLLTTSTSTRTSTSTSTITSNPYWNSNSQKVADLVVSCGWNAQVGMLHDICENGCNDYVGGLPCNNTFWTTSDNVPTCWTLGDFGYASIQSTCIQTVTNLQAFSVPRDGMRYEPYTGSPIIVGNPGDIHTILQPSGNDIQCPQTGCGGYSWGTLTNGQKYNIQSDEWNGNGKGTPRTGVGVDIEAPQAINLWLRGNLQLGTSLANDLVNRMVSSNWIGSGSTWQLGQILFVMRIYGLDSSQAFTNGVNELWSLQSSAGYLPNSYSAKGPGSGHDVENMDAGLLPFSVTLIDQVKADFGLYSMGSAPN